MCVCVCILRKQNLATNLRMNASPRQSTIISPYDQKTIYAPLPRDTRTRCRSFRRNTRWEKTEHFSVPFSKTYHLARMSAWHLHDKRSCTRPFLIFLIPTILTIRTIPIPMSGPVDFPS